MKPAKEMFEELGFKHIEGNSMWFGYADEDQVEVNFYYTHREYMVENCGNSVCIDMKLTRAIIKQLKELGWDDEFRYWHWVWELGYAYGGDWKLTSRVDTDSFDDMFRRRIGNYFKTEADGLANFSKVKPILTVLGMGETDD